MPLKLMKSDQPTWTFINKLSKQIKDKEDTFFLNEEKKQNNFSYCNTQEDWMKGEICGRRNVSFLRIRRIKVNPSPTCGDYTFESLFTPWDIIRPNDFEPLYYMAK